MDSEIVLWTLVFVGGYGLALALLLRIALTDKRSDDS